MRNCSYLTLNRHPCHPDRSGQRRQEYKGHPCPVDPAFRSSMNIPFRLKVEELEAIFLERAEKAGLFNLKGHRSVGGMRASIYNAVPVSWVEELGKFMNDFENEYG